MNRLPGSGDLVPGDRLGPYVVEARAGAGGHAVVYRARDPRDGSPVALKVLKAGSTSDTEAAALARVRHDRVIALRGVERLGERPVLVFEWMPGGSLSVEFARGPASAARVEALARDLLSGLGAAHAVGVLHRDVKPSNVLLDADGRPKVGDFGIASSGDGAASPTAGRVEGSPAYLAPEAVRGEPATERSDLWSLGVLLFRALNGRLPFEGETDAEIFHAILSRRPFRPETAVEGLSPGLADLVDRCLRRRPEHRPASCAEALLVLEGRAGSAPLDEEDRPLGRDAELSDLDAWMREVAGGRSSFVLMRGAESVGVSTILAAAAVRAHELGLVHLPVVVGGEGFLRAAVRAATQALAARRDAPSAEIEAACRRLHPSAEASVESEAPVELLRDLELVLRGAAGARPFVLAIDETHRADADDWRRIEAVVRAVTRDGGAAIVAVRRPAEGPVPLAGLASDPRARVVEVAPLPPPILVEILDRDAGGRLDSDVGSLLSERAGGSPRRARALLAHLLAGGAIVRRDGAVIGTPGWRDRAVLPDASERLRASLSGLAPTSRALVEAAAVDGEEADPGALARVLGREEREVVAELARLSDPISGIFGGAGSSFVFAGPGMRAAVLGGLSDARRRELHRRFAQVLDVEGASSERLGLHLDGAGEAERARPFLVRAAIAASRRFERLRSLELARRAGVSADGLLPPVTPDVLTCAFRVSAHLSVLRRLEERRAVDRAIDAWARAAGDDEVRDRVAVGALVEALLARSPTAAEVGELRRVASVVRDPITSTRAHLLLGRIAADALRPDEAEREYRESIRIARAADRLDLAAEAHGRLGSLYFESGRAAQGAEELGIAGEIHEARGHRVNAAINRFKLGLHRFDVEASTVGVCGLVREVDEMRDAGAEFPAAMARGELARTLRTSGDLAAALAHGERAVADLTRLRVEASIGPVRLELAAIRLAMADFDGAERELEAGLELSATDSATAGDRRRMAAAEVLVALASGHVARALAALDRALLPPGAHAGVEEDTVPLLVEGLLVSDRDDARRVLAALASHRERLPSSHRLVPPALLACARRILGVAPEPGDEGAVAAVLASEFLRDHHLVARVATLWAESTRLAALGDAEAAGATRSVALARATRAGHVGLMEALRSREDR